MKRKLRETGVTAHLRVKNVSKSYDGVRNAVADVSIDVAKGEFLSLLGPSGSGKSTTLMMLAGFELPDVGVVELAGTDITRTPPYRRNMGMVFQGYALFPHMTVEDNIRFPLRMRHSERARSAARVDQLLALVHLDEHRHKYSYQLSGGQQQRVALARALAAEPEVLLLDEPLAALDKNLREQMQIELKRIHAELGVTMIFVTHDQSEAMGMSDRVAVFSDGAIAQIGAPLEVYNAPVNHFVGQFVGDSNIFSLQHSVSAPGRAALQGGEEIRLPRLHEAASPIDLLVRPERLHLVGPDDSSTHNTMTLNVETVIDYGDRALVIGRYHDREVRMRVSGGKGGLQPGVAVRVGWKPDDAHILDRS